MKTAFIPAWLDDLQLDVYEFRLYCHALRRGELYASVENICQICGFDRKKLFQTIVTLESKDLLKVTRMKGKTNRMTAVRPVPKREHLPVPKTEQELSRIRHTKDTPIKETPIKEKKADLSFCFPYDSDAFKQAWQLWTDERKDRKKPLSKRAVNLQIGKMKGFTEKEVIDSIHAAIEKNWATIYPKKEINSNQPRTTTETTKPRGFND
jgi:hypothetical protein